MTLSADNKLQKWILVHFVGDTADRQFIAIWPSYGWRDYHQSFSNPKWHIVGTSDSEEELEALGNIMGLEWIGRKETKIWTAA